MNEDGYLDYREFLTGLIKIYCSNFDQKTKLVFDIYDFDSDGFVSKEDISTVLAYMPPTQDSTSLREGKFTSDGGGISSFKQRYESLEELYNILDLCFGDKERIDIK